MITNQDKALQGLDNAKFGWFHIKACLVSGIGFYTDAYDLFIISLASQMIGYVYYVDNNNAIPTNLETFLKMSALVGTLLGQILFGYLADLLGRKKMYGAELLIIILTTVMSSFAADTAKGMTMISMLILWRFFLGIGIGGDYPLSAIITSEFANTRNRGAMMGAVFAMQGFGILTASLVSMATLRMFKEAIQQDQQNLDYVWRIVIGLGALPGLCALYFRLTIPESPRFKIEVRGDVEGAVQDIAQITNNTADITTQVSQRQHSNFPKWIRKWRHLKILLGTSMTWFALDVAFYGINLNNPIILNKIGFSKSDDPYESLQNASLGNFVIALLGSVPGYWLTVYFVDTLGRKTIQIMGFVLLTLLFLLLGALFNEIIDLSVLLFIGIYTMTNLFTNFGPNATTFIIPGEVFPTKYRATCHGISAASGKLGAIVSQVGFIQLKNIGGKDQFIPELLMIFSLFMFIGLLFTFLIPETKGRSLEEISRDYELKASQIHLIEKY